MSNAASVIGFDSPRRAMDHNASMREFASLHHWGTAPHAAHTRPRVRVAPGQITVLEDEHGHHHALVATDEGLCPIPWIPGDAAQQPDAAVPHRGLATRQQVQHAAASRRASPENIAVCKAMLAALVKVGLIDIKALAPALRRQIRAMAAAMPDPPTNRPSPASPGAPAADQSSPSTPAAPGPDAPQSKDSPDQPSQLEQAAIDAAPSAIFGILGAGLANGGFPPPSALLGGALGFAGGILQGLAMNQLMSLLGGAPKDTDSTLKWALSLLGPKLAGMMLDKGLVSDKFLGSLDGPYQGAALRVGDVNEKCEAITAGEPSVQIEGLPAARHTDAMDANGGAVEFGAEKVLIAGKPAARADNTCNPHYGSRSTKTQSWFPCCNGAKRTIIGGQTSNPRPEVPKEFQDANPGMDSGKNMDKEESPTKDNMPEDRTYVWDPDEREWYIWDPEQGFSGNLTGHANLVDVPDFIKSILGWPDSGWGDTLGQNDWTLFGLNLGSPHWPGAGNATLWWIPDELWGIDMSPYYIRHDWIADFADPDHATGFLNWIPWEAESFWAGIDSHQGLGQWILQIIYSTATSIVSIAEIFDNFLQWLDHSLGFPDRYGDPNHGGIFDGPRK